MANMSADLKIRIRMSFMDAIKWRILGLHKKNLTIDKVGEVTQVTAVEPK